MPRELLCSFMMPAPYHGPGCCEDVVTNPLEVGSVVAQSCRRARNSSSVRGPWACPVVQFWYASMKRIAATVCGRLACERSSCLLSCPGKLWPERCHRGP